MKTTTRDLRILLSTKYDTLYYYDELTKNTKSEIVEFLKDIALKYQVTLDVDKLLNANLPMISEQIKMIYESDEVIARGRVLVNNHNLVSDLEKVYLSYLNYISEGAVIGNSPIINKGFDVDINDAMALYDVKLRRFELYNIEFWDVEDKEHEFVMYLLNRFINSNKIYTTMDRTICRMMHDLDLAHFNFRNMQIRENLAYNIKLAYINNRITQEEVINIAENVNELIRFICAMDNIVKTDINLPVTIDQAYTQIKFMKFTRPTRKAIMKKIHELLLDNITTTVNDIHANKSIMKLIASKIHPFEKYNMKHFKESVDTVWTDLVKGRLRNNYTTLVERLIRDKDVDGLCKVLHSTDLIRRVNKICELCESNSDIDTLVNKIVNSNSTMKNYIQAYQFIVSKCNSYFKKEKQIVMTNVISGNMDNLRFREIDIPKDIDTYVAVAIALKNKIGEISSKMIKSHYPELIDMIDESVKEDRVFKLNIDNDLNNKTLSLGGRYKSISFEESSRFSSIVTNQTKLRAFTHWIGDDVDLYANLYDGNMEYKNQCYFGHMSSMVREPDGNGGFISRNAIIHSGDVRNAPAPDGGNEYVDIDIDLLRLTDIKYIVIHNNSYDCDDLSAYEDCYTGITTYDENDRDKFIKDDITFKCNVKSKSSSVLSLLLVINDDNVEIISLDTEVKSRFGFDNRCKEFTKNLCKYAMSYSFFTVYDLLHYGINFMYGGMVDVTNSGEPDKSITMNIPIDVVEEYLGSTN